MQDFQNWLAPNASHQLFQAFALGTFTLVTKLIDTEYYFTSVIMYEAVLVSKLRLHFIVLILHFMLYFSHLMLN